MNAGGRFALVHKARRNPFPQNQKDGLRRRLTLYLADLGEIWRIIQSIEVQSLLVVGHNPGLGLLAHRLPELAIEDPRSFHYPTGATMVFQTAKATFLDCSVGEFEIVDQSFLS